MQRAGVFRYDRSMYSDNLDIEEFKTNTQDMSQTERYRAAQQELRDADKLPFHRRKGATKEKDRQITQYILDLKYWIQHNYH